MTTWCEHPEPHDGCPADFHVVAPSGAGRVREAIARDRGEYAPSGPVSLCGAPDGTERRADDTAQHHLRPRRLDHGHDPIRRRRPWLRRLLEALRRG